MGRAVAMNNDDGWQRPDEVRVSRDLKMRTRNLVLKNKFGI